MCIRDRPQVALHHVPRRRPAQHRLHLADHFAGVDAVRRLHNLCHLRPARRIDDYVLLRRQVKQLTWLKVIDFGDRFELNANNCLLYKSYAADDLLCVDPVSRPIL